MRCDSRGETTSWDCDGLDDCLDRAAYAMTRSLISTLKLVTVAYI